MKHLTCSSTESVRASGCEREARFQCDGEFLLFIRGSWYAGVAGWRTATKPLTQGGLRFFISRTVTACSRASALDSARSRAGENRRGVHTRIRTDRKRMRARRFLSARVLKQTALGDEGIPLSLHPRLRILSILSEPIKSPAGGIASLPGALLSVSTYIYIHTCMYAYIYTMKRSVMRCADSEMTL